jgi:hypothetical protein
VLTVLTASEDVIYVLRGGINFIQVIYIERLSYTFVIISDGKVFLSGADG